MNRIERNKARTLTTAPTVELDTSHPIEPLPQAQSRRTCHEGPGHKRQWWDKHPHNLCSHQLRLGGHVSEEAQRGQYWD